MCDDKTKKTEIHTEPQTVKYREVSWGGIRVSPAGKKPTHIPQLHSSGTHRTHTSHRKITFKG